MLPLWLFYALWFQISMAVRDVADNGTREIKFHRNCIYYEKGGTNSLHCEEKIHIRAVLLKSVILPSHSLTTVIITCDDGSVSNPYEYLSLLDLQGYDTLVLNIDGCPPPNEGYSFLKTRKGENFSQIGDDFLNVRLKVFCLHLKAFQLNSRHLRKLRQVSRLQIDCPVFSSADGDLLSDIRDVKEIQITNTTLETFPTISHLHNLEVLWIPNNMLTSIPSLHGSQNLYHLDINNNKIEYLNEDTFQHTKNLKFLFMDDNLLKSLPESVLDLDQLQMLTARNNRLHFVNLSCKTSLPSLTNLHLDGNELQLLEPPQNFSTKAPTSSAQSEGIESFGPITTDTESPSSTTARVHCPIANKRNVGVSSSVMYRYCKFRLTLRKNSLTYIPETLLHNLTRLHAVDFSSNKISSLPPKLLRQNKCLTHFDVSNNNISSVSDSLLLSSTKLEVVDFSNNRISALGADFFSGLQQLTMINLGNNSIASLPDGIFNTFNATANVTRALVLNLEGNLLSSLPTLMVSRLTELNLARNRLTQLPLDTLKHVHSLVRINLSHNLIERIETTNASFDWDDSEDGGALFHQRLESLVEIDLSHNRLTRLATVASIRDNVKSLDLRGNKFVDYLEIFHADGRYPDKILRRLERLDMSKNSMMAPCNIPRQEASPLHVKYPRMNKLKELDLSWNRLTLSMSYNDSKVLIKFHLPTERGPCDSFLKHMPKLEVLKLSHNEIDIIPEYVRYLTKLRVLDLSHNRIQTVQYHDYFFVDGLRRGTVETLGDSPWNYFPRGEEYFQLPNTHNLTVDLRHNRISSMEFPAGKMQSVPKGSDVEPKFSKATMLLGNNPIVCSCQVLTLLQYHQREIRPVSEEERWNGEKLMLPAAVDLRELSCSEPQSVRGKNLSDPETWMYHLLPLCGLCRTLGRELD